MKKPKLLDVIKLNADIPEFGLKSGDVGAIVEVFDKPREAYEVEFVNEDGTVKATCTLTKNKFDILDQGPW